MRKLQLQIKKIQQPIWPLLIVLCLSITACSSGGSSNPTPTPKPTPTPTPPTLVIFQESLSNFNSGNYTFESISFDITTNDIAVKNGCTGNGVLTPMTCTANTIGNSSINVQISGQGKITLNSTGMEVESLATWKIDTPSDTSPISFALAFCDQGSLIEPFPFNSFSCAAQYTNTTLGTLHPGGETYNISITYNNLTDALTSITFK